MEQSHDGHGQTQGDVAYDEQEAGSEKGVLIADGTATDIWQML